ncbi:hypothetical protein HYU18_00935 [Candidatus Woesearchaeota archaeon]|nr:hypothetical protein [Candidatus Woesearchaeota archaeon]
MAETIEESKPEVKTGADRLLELVRASKEVALAEAAKKLGVSPATVEAWATFLEEDGLVSLKYKFTTPYIAVPEQAEAKKWKRETPHSEELELTEVSANLEGMRETLDKAAEEKQAGEFGMLMQTYSALIARLRAVNDSLIEKAEVSPQKKAWLIDLIKAADTTLKEAETQARAGKFDDANISYTRLYQQAQTLSEELNKINEQTSALHAIEQTKDYKDILAKAYQLMNEGKVEEANELYDRLKFVHENLAKDFRERKRQMEDDLVKFNNDLAKSIDQANQEKLLRIKGRITTLLHAGTRFLKKDEFDIAESYYLAIKHEYEALPPGFVEEKKTLQQSILAFYSALAKKREKGIKTKFDALAKQISSLISQAQEMLKEYKVEEAVRAYKEIGIAFQSLPAGFMKEKSELQEKILPLHTAIASRYTKESLGKLKERSGEILSLLAKMNTATDKNELKEAEANYGKIRQLYREMPKGFLHEETELQNQIVEAYERYLEKAKHTESAQTQKTLSRVTALVQKAEAALKARDHKTANDAYLEMVKLYDTLPSGFVAQKKETREKMLHTYKALLSTPVEEHRPNALKSLANVPAEIGKEAKEMLQMRLPDEIGEAIEAGKEEIEELVTGKDGQQDTIPETTEEKTQTSELSAPATPQEEADNAVQSNTQPQQAVRYDRVFGPSLGNDTAPEVRGMNPMKKSPAIPETEDIKRIDEEIDDIEEKIEQLKSISKATVKYPKTGQPA